MTNATTVTVELVPPVFATVELVPPVFATVELVPPVFATQTPIRFKKCSNV